MAQLSKQQGEEEPWSAKFAVLACLTPSLKVNISDQHNGFEGWEPCQWVCNHIHCPAISYCTQGWRGAQGYQLTGACRHVMLNNGETAVTVNILAPWNKLKSWWLS